MAIVVIVIQDKPDDSGGVDVRLDCEPAPHPLARAQTQAQKLATVVLNAVHEQLQEDKTPRLQLITPH